MSESFEALSSSPTVRRIVVSTKATVTIHVSERFYFDTSWSGGARDEFSAFDTTSLAPTADYVIVDKHDSTMFGPSGGQHGAVVLNADIGVLGYRRGCPTINLHPDSPLLAAIRSELPNTSPKCDHSDCQGREGCPHVAGLDAECVARDKAILRIFRCYKPFARREELARTVKDYSDADLQRLAAQGFLKVAKNGATSLTPIGKVVAAS